MHSVRNAGFVFFFAALAAGYCPVPESIASCKCNSIEGGEISLQCEGPGNDDDIPSVIETLKDSPNLELVLKSLAASFSPSSFEHVSSLHLHDARIDKAISNSSFLWPKLCEVILASSIVDGRSVPDFKDAQQLIHFEISEIEIPTVGPTFKESTPDGLIFLAIRKTLTTTVEPKALSHLKKLQYFIMVDLPFQEFPRNALPVVMPDLHTFILGNTKINKLKADFFHGMPKLEILMMNGNELTTLDSNLFAPVENQLTHLLAERNPLVCDCNLLWLKKNAQKRSSMKILATCKDHATLKRKEVTSLDENEYCS